MEQNHSSQNNNQIKVQNNSNNNILDLFKEVFILIFKKWTSFRLALDHNPKILIEYVDDEETQLEIEAMMEILFDDIYKELNNNYLYTKIVVQNLSEILLNFIEDFFRVDMQDGSEEHVSKSLLKAFNELKNGKSEYLIRLREIDQKANNKYNISFPITSEDKMVKKIKRINISDSEDESDSQGDEEEDQCQSTDVQPDDDGFVVVKKGKKY